jgi:predicted nucleotidyltransferase
MVTLDTLQQEKRTEIVRLGEKYGARNIPVFGSVVRGDNRAESDVRLLVDMDRTGLYSTSLDSWRMSRTCSMPK